MKLSKLVFRPADTPDGSMGLEVSQDLASPNGQRWKIIRAAADHNDICVADPDNFRNSKELKSQLELACWLMDKFEI